MNAAMQDTIEREITVRAPKERVFSAIADPTQITAWFPDAVEGTFVVGEKPVLDFGEYGQVMIYVVAVNPHDYFAYRWVPGGTGSTAEDPLARANTLVEFTLHEVPDGTVVKLKESGFASLPAEVYQKAVSDNTEGWEFMMGRLEKLLAQD